MRVSLLADLRRVYLTSNGDAVLPSVLLLDHVFCERQQESELCGSVKDGTLHFKHASRKIMSFICNTLLKLGGHSLFRENASRRNKNLLSLNVHYKVSISLILFLIVASLI